MAGDERETHIWRVFQKDDPESDTWVDVERIDKITVFVDGRQKVRYTFDWEDWERQGGPSGPHKKKVITEPSDPDNKIEVPMRISVRLPSWGRTYNHYFLNDQANAARRTHSRRVYHHDIKTDPERPPKDSERYKENIGVQDPDQYLDVEVIDAYWVSGDFFKNKFSHSPRLFDGRRDSTTGVNGQLRQWIGTKDDPLLQDPLVQSDVAGGIPPFGRVENPRYGRIDPPWRIDPLQNIVNVQWGGLAVIFGEGFSDAGTFSDQAK